MGVPVPASPVTVPSECRSDPARSTAIPFPSAWSAPGPTPAPGLRWSRARNPSTSAGAATPSRPPPGSISGSTSTGWCSPPTPPATDGRPPRGAPLDTSGANVRHVSLASTSADVKVRTDGTPFWLVLGESHSDGWEASVSHGTVGSSQVVNGYANGFLVRPGHAGTVDIHLNWLRNASCGSGSRLARLRALVRDRAVRGPPPLRRSADPPLPPALASCRASAWCTPATPRPGWPATLAVAVGALARWSPLFSRPWIGVVVGLATVVAVVWSPAWCAMGVAAPIVLVVSRARDRARARVAHDRLVDGRPGGAIVGEVDGAAS